MIIVYYNKNGIITVNLEKTFMASVKLIDAESKKYFEGHFDNIDCGWNVMIWWTDGETTHHPISEADAIAVQKQLLRAITGDDKVPV